MEIIRFDTNVPQEMAFTYPNGKEMDGRYGTQFFRATTDERGVYLPRIVEDKLITMRVAAGERVEICKAEQKEGRKRVIRWEVKRVDPPGDPAWDNLDRQPQQPRNGLPAKNNPPAAATNASTQPKPSATQQAQATTPQKGQTQMSHCLAACAIAAIDAAIIAEEYAHSKKYSLKFGEDQVQAMAVSLYIQHCKSDNIAQMHANQTTRANGGAEPWQH